VRKQYIDAEKRFCLNATHPNLDLSNEEDAMTLLACRPCAESAMQRLEIELVFQPSGSDSQETKLGCRSITPKKKIICESASSPLAGILALGASQKCHEQPFAFAEVLTHKVG
jgi:hypothetical protein